MTDYEKQLRAGLKGYGIPERMHSSVCGYVLRGLNTGSFLTAIFSNDLVGAATRADGENSQLLYSYACFLVNYVPIGAWGSIENVRDWRGIEN